jgi:hypothetical protein
MHWQEIIKEFTAEEQKGHGFAASLVLMYLAFGQQYGYKMAEDFKRGLTAENGWKEEQLKYLSKLKDVNQLNVLLNSLEHKGLLISSKEEKGRRRKFFQLHEDIIISSYCMEGVDGLIRGLSKSRFLANEETERALICSFLDALSNRNRETYFSRWSAIEKFDYLTFLGILKEEAKDMKNEEMVSLLNKNIHEILQIEQEMITFKTHIETAERIRSENKARGIKDELNPVVNIIDAFEENTEQ